MLQYQSLQKIYILKRPLANRNTFIHLSKKYHAIILDLTQAIRLMNTDQFYSLLVREVLNLLMNNTLVSA